MQLTIMGVLALKSTDLESSSTGWSEYAKIVLSISPLLLLTYFVYNMLDRAYLRQCTNIPLEVFGKIDRQYGRNDIVNNVTFETEMTPLIGNHPNLSSTPEHEISARDEPQESQFIHSVLETPMTRVDGILDQAFFPSEMQEQKDVNSYLHPALIGRMPIFWIPHSSFDHLRSEQINNQSRILSRHNFRQTATREDNGLQPFYGGRIDWFFESLMNWIHRLIS